MEGENNSFKPKAFFRSLLAFNEEGLYEAPYTHDVISFPVTQCILFASNLI